MTIELGILSLIIALLISFPIGIYSAVRQDTVSDYVTRSIAILLISVPSFWVGIIVVVFPSIWWGWSPPIINISLWEDPWGNLKMYILPAAILGMAINGVNMRLTRTMMLEVVREGLHQDGLLQGPDREGRRVQARRQERADTRNHRGRDSTFPSS